MSIWPNCSWSVGMGISTNLAYSGERPNQLQVGTYILHVREWPDVRCHLEPRLRPRAQRFKEELRVPESRRHRIGVDQDPPHLYYTFEVTPVFGSIRAWCSLIRSLPSWREPDQGDADNRENSH